MSRIETADGLALAMDELQKGTMIAALMATERVTERLADPDHDWRDTDLIKAQGVNVDKVVALQNRPKAPEESGVALLAAMLETSDITLTKRDAASEAIDVTPEKDDAG